MLENVIDTVENCRYCLMCRHVGSVGLVSGLETLTPHGIALTIASQRRGLIDWNEETIGIVYSDPDAGNSRAHCVNDQPLPEAVAAVRAELASAGLAPRAVYETREALERWGTPFAEREPEPVTGSGEVALFAGDEAPYLWPAALPAVQKLLAAAGADPVLVGNGRNNGLLASSLGFPELARRLAQDTLAELESSSAQRLLVLSPGDHFVFAQANEERLGLPWPERIALSEVVQFLAEQLAAGHIAFRPMPQRAAFAYVDPTHAVRHAARHDAVRQLVAAVLPGDRRELFFRRGSAQPVGSTHLQFSRPDLAVKLTIARLQDALDTGAELLVCEDPATLHQLARYAGEFGLRVRGLYELLAEQLI